MRHITPRGECQIQEQAATTVGTKGTRKGTRTTAAEQGTTQLFHATDSNFQEKQLAIDVSSPRETNHNATQHNAGQAIA